MDGVAVVRGRDEDLDAVRGHALGVEPHLHREPGGEEADPGGPRGADAVGGGVDEVGERDRDGRFDAVGDEVHRVGAQADEVGAAAFEGRGRVGEELPGAVPVPVALHRLDLREVDGDHEAAGVVLAAEAVPDVLVDEPVVLGGRLPGHAADESDGAHRPIVPRHAKAAPATPGRPRGAVRRRRR
nr:hypothetical protein GCM10025732_46590 [Glycomyces mayteni]